MRFVCVHKISVYQIFLYNVRSVGCHLDLVTIGMGSYANIFPSVDVRCVSSFAGTAITDYSKGVLRALRFDLNLISSIKKSILNKAVFFEIVI